MRKHKLKRFKINQKSNPEKGSQNPNEQYKAPYKAYRMLENGSKIEIGRETSYTASRELYTSGVQSSEEDNYYQLPEGVSQSEWDWMKEAINESMQSTSVEKGIKEAEEESNAPALVDDPGIVAVLNDPLVGAYIQELKGEGMSLSEDLLASLGFAGASGVKVHTDDIAILLCELMNARAFAYGNDIFFNEGEFDLSSDAGRQLMAHELTHVGRQTSNAGKKVQRQVKKIGRTRVRELVTLLVLKKNKISNLSLPKLLKIVGLFVPAAEMVEFSKEIPSTEKETFGQKLPEGAKPGKLEKLDINLTKKQKNYIKAEGPMLPIERIKYGSMEEDIYFTSGRGLLLGMKLDVDMKRHANDSKSAKDDIVTGNIKIETDFAGLSDIYLKLGKGDEKSELWIRELKLPGFTLSIENTVLGLYSEMSVFNVTPHLFGHINSAFQLLLAGIMRMYGQFTEANSAPSSDMIEQQIASSLNGTAISVLFDSLNVAGLKYAKANEKPIEVQGLSSREGVVGLQGSDMGMPSAKRVQLQQQLREQNELLDEKNAELKSLTRELDENQQPIEEIESGSNSDAAIERINDNILKVSIEIAGIQEEIRELVKEIGGVGGQNVKDQKFHLFAQAEDVVLYDPSNLVNTALNAGGINGQASLDNQLNVKRIKVTSDLSAQEASESRVEVEDLEIPMITFKDHTSIAFGEYNAAFDFAQFYQMKASATLMHTPQITSEGTTKGGFELRTLILKGKMAAFDGLVIESVTGPLYKGEGRTKGFDFIMEMNEGELKGLYAENLSAVKVTIMNRMASLDKISAKMFDLKIGKDKETSVQLYDLNAKGNYTDPQSKNQVEVDVKNLSTIGRYKDNVIYIDDFSLGAIEIPDLNIESEDKLSYIRLPKGKTAMLDQVYVSAEIHLKEIEGKKEPDCIIIPKFFAGSITATGLQAKLIKKDKMISINAKPDEIAGIYGMEGAFDTEGIRDSSGNRSELMAMFSAGGIDLPGLKVLVENVLSVGGNVRTGKLNFTQGINGEQDILLDDINLVLSQLGVAAVPGLDSKDLLGRAITIGRIGMHKNEKQISNYFVEDVTVNGIRIEDLDTGDIYEIDVHLSGRADIKNVKNVLFGPDKNPDYNPLYVEQEEFKPDYANALLIESKDSFTITRFQMISSRLKNVPYKSPEETSLDNANDYTSSTNVMENMEYNGYSMDGVKQQRIIDLELELDRAEDNLQTDHIDEYVQKQKVLYNEIWKAKQWDPAKSKDKEEQYQKAEYQTELFESMDTASGKLILNAFGSQFNIDLENGYLNLDQFSQVTKALPEYIRNSPGEVFQDPNLIEYAEDLDGWVQIGGFIIDDYKPVYNLLVSIKNGNGHAGFADFITPFANNMEIIEEDDMIALKIITGSTFPLCSKDDYLSEDEKSPHKRMKLSGFLDTQNRKAIKDDIGPITSFDELNELTKRVSEIKNRTGKNFSELMKSINDLEKDDFLFMKNYSEIYSTVYDWFLKKYFVELIGSELKNFELHIENVNSENIASFINKSSLGTIKFGNSRLNVDIGQSNLTNYNLNPLILQNGFSYTNEERNLRVDASSTSLGGASLVQGIDNGTASFSDLKLQNLKLYIRTK